MHSKASHTPFVALFERVIQTFHQLHPALQKFCVRYSLAGPTLQDFVYTETFFAAEFLVGKVGIVNGFGDHPHFAVADSEVFLEGFKRTILAAMPKAFTVKHVEGHSAVRHLIFQGKCKSCFWIDEAPDQPCRCRPIYTWSRSGYPHSVLVVPKIDLRSRLCWFLGPASISTCKELRHPLL